MFAPSNRFRCRLSGWLGILAVACSPLVPAQQRKTPPASSPLEHVCGCPDGRQFAVGASMYGMNSARVLITGLRPDPSPGARGELPRCTDILVLGQAVRFLRAADGRPFLKRESLKRGAIRNVCHTRIHFIEAKKSYDF